MTTFRRRQRAAIIAATLHRVSLDDCINIAFRQAESTTGDLHETWKHVVEILLEMNSSDDAVSNVLSLCLDLR